MLMNLRPSTEKHPPRNFGMRLRNACSSEVARRRVAERLRATATQRPMDSGLFGDEWKQRDLF
jgi:hypothetical protein